MIKNKNHKEVTEILNEYSTTSKLSQNGFLPHDATIRILRAYGIPTLPIRLATSGEEAALLAQQVGFPVVLKLASLDISHKSDFGGVMLNLKSIAEVKKGYDSIIQKFKRYCTQTKHLGCENSTDAHRRPRSNYWCCSG